MKKNGLRKIELIIIYTICVAVLASILFIEVYVYFISPRAYRGQPFYLTINILVLSVVLILLTSFFLSYLKMARDAKTLRDFQKKFEFITTASDIVIMQYDVMNRNFIRWNPSDTQTYRKFSVKDFWNHIHPDDLPVAHNVVDFMDSQNDLPYTCEYRYCMPGNNKHIWQYIDIFPFSHDSEGKVASYIGICRRNSKWHEVEDKLEHFRQNVSFITSANGILFIRYNVADDTLYHLDNSGELTESTITLEEYLGSVHPDDLTYAKELLAIMRVHKRERFQTEYRYRLPGSDKYDWFAINVVACDYDKYHRISGYLCLCRNNNEWRKAMDEMICLRDKAESANKMKNAFLANMSHEIRTPLNAVVGFSSMITDEMPGDEREKFKQVIAHNNKLLLQIVDDVLTLSKIESGDIDFINSTFDINDFMQSIIDPMRLTIHDKVKLICQSQEHFNICFDSRRLTEVVSTLLINANKFTPEGTITISYRQESEGLFISITDTGIGIDKKDQERIFQRFEKVNTYVSGTGLGLSICKGIVEQAHGTIGVESELGKGSTFWFRIPCTISK